MIVMSGLPKVGKTFVARRLAQFRNDVYIGVDEIAGVLGSVEGIDVVMASYLAAREMARSNLSLGVIVDGANDTSWQRDLWTQLSAERDEPLVFCEVYCTDVAAHRARAGAADFDEILVRFAEASPWGSEPRWLVNNLGRLDTAELSASLDAML